MSSPENELGTHSNESDALIEYRSAAIGMGPTYLGHFSQFLTPEQYRLQLERDRRETRVILQATVLGCTVAAAIGLILYGLGYGDERPKGQVVKTNHSGAPLANLHLGSDDFQKTAQTSPLEVNRAIIRTRENIADL